MKSEEFSPTTKMMAEDIVTHLRVSICHWYINESINKSKTAIVVKGLTGTLATANLIKAEIAIEAQRRNNVEVFDVKRIRLCLIWTELRVD